MEAAIRELMGAGTPPRFKFQDTYESIEFPSGYTIPSQATLEAKYDELLALEEDIQKMVMEGDLEVGTSNLFVDTETGNVGIGTTSPGYKLDVHGSANVGALTATTGSFSGEVTTPYISGYGYVAERSYTFNPTNNTNKYFLCGVSEDNVEIEIRDNGYGHGQHIKVIVQRSWGGTPRISVFDSVSTNYTFYYTQRNDLYYLWFNENGGSNGNNVNYYIKIRSSSSSINTTEPAATYAIGGVTLGVNGASEITGYNLHVEGSGNVGIGTASPDDILETFDNVGRVKITRNANNNNFGCALDFALYNNASEKITYARVGGSIQDNTDGSEDGFLSFQVRTAGVLNDNYGQDKM
jgi:hypothetical protein